MGDFVVRKSVRETLVGAPVGNFRVQRAVRETLAGAPVGNFIVRRAVREVLVGTVLPPTGTVIPRRAAQIIG